MTAICDLEFIFGLCVLKVILSNNSSLCKVGIVRILSDVPWRDLLDLTRLRLLLAQDVSVACPYILLEFCYKRPSSVDNQVADLQMELGP